MGGGVSDIRHARACGGNACVLPQHVQCESARRASATEAPYPQARPIPRTLSARARLHAAGEGRHDDSMRIVTSSGQASRGAFSFS